MGMGMGMAMAPAMGSGDPPGSWACPGCRNVNWPRRTVCNKCNLPKPAGMDAAGMGVMGMPAMAAPMPAMAPPGTAVTNIQPAQVQLQIQAMQQRMQMQQMQGSQMAAGGYGGYGGGMGMQQNHQPHPGQHPPGSWTCGACANVNWPRRTSCNRCQARPDPAALAMMQQQTGAQAPGYSAQPTAAYAAYGGGMPAGMPAGGGNPEGSWPCPNASCGNINWPKRSTCNRCQLPKPAEYGPPQPY